MAVCYQSSLGQQSDHRSCFEENIIPNLWLSVLAIPLTSENSRIKSKIFTEAHPFKYASMIECTSFPNHLLPWKLRASIYFKWWERKKVSTDPLHFGLPQYLQMCLSRDYNLVLNIIIYLFFSDDI